MSTSSQYMALWQSHILQNPQQMVIKSHRVFCFQCTVAIHLIPGCISMVRVIFAHKVKAFIIIQGIAFTPLPSYILKMVSHDPWQYTKQTALFLDHPFRNSNPVFYEEGWTSINAKWDGLRHSWLVIKQLCCIRTASHMPPVPISTYFWRLYIFAKKDFNTACTP